MMVLILVSFQVMPTVLTMYLNLMTLTGKVSARHVDYSESGIHGAEANGKANGQTKAKRSTNLKTSLMTISWSCKKKNDSNFEPTTAPS